MHACRNAPGLAVLAAATAIGLAACGSSSSTPHVASLAKSNGSSGGSATAAAPKGNATKLADEWAACERSHGDTNQADPVIGIHDEIYITRPGPGGGGGLVGDPHYATGECSQYLVAAQIALRAADPVQDPEGVTNQAEIVKFATCMRANGVPNYPYPDGDQTNFNGTGVDPNSPAVVRVNDLCGKKIGAPSWWINGTDTPGDIEVQTAGLHYPLPGSSCAIAKNGCPGLVTVPGSGSGSGSNG